MSQPPPKMIRVYSGNSKGATAFFRNRPLLDTLSELLAGQSPSVLFHAASIGAEPYSFAAHCQMRGIRCRHIHATDISPEFRNFAEKAQYPVELLNDMSGEEKAFFELSGKTMAPIPSIRNAVTFLPSCSFVDARFSQSYDVVFVTNALTYVTPAEQTRAIANIAQYNRRYLITTAFHQASIKSDLMANHYVPITDSLEAIHNGWGDRIVSNAPSDHSWMLPPFSKIPDYEYKYCALFEKHSS